MNETDSQRNIDKNKKEKLISLSDFIENNHKLISSLGIFTALTAFSMNITNKYFKFGLSFLSLTLSVMLFIELIGQFPKKGASLLGWFETVLTFTFLGYVCYWIIDYYTFWKLFLIYLIQLFIVGTVSFIIKKFDLFNKLFKTNSGQKKNLRYLLFFLVILFSSYIGLYLGRLISPKIKEILSWCNIFSVK